MAFEFVRHNLAGRERRLQRFFEIAPAAAAWTLLAGLIALDIFAPLIASVVMIALLSYWLLRIVYTTLFLIIGFWRLQIETDTDWEERLNDLYRPEREVEAAEVKSFRQRMSRRSHLRRKQALLAAGEIPVPKEQIYHLVMFPIARESREIYEPSVRAVAAARYDRSRMIVVLAVEERAPEAIRTEAQAFVDEYRHLFFDMRIVIHPDGIAGEVKSKGSNMTYCAKQMVKYLDERNIPYSRVIVSALDSDTIPTPHYFACLSYFYVVAPNRENVSYQPIPLFTNNIWNVPAYARVLLMGSSAWQMIEATDPDMLVLFSSHSVTLSALVENGYWPTDALTDDAGFYYKALINSNATFRVIPVPIVIAMDVAESESFFKTFVEIYRQQRRWAWGVENLATALRGILPSRGFKFREKVRYAIKMFDNFLTWATLPIILTGLAWLPSAIAGIFHLQQAVAAFNYGRISALIFRLSSVNLVVMMIVTLVLTLRYSRGAPLRKKLLYPLEWLLIPVITLFLNAAPALDAMTRLALGNSLEYVVASKRKIDSGTHQAESGHDAGAAD